MLDISILLIKLHILFYLSFDIEDDLTKMIDVNCCGNFPLSQNIYFYSVEMFHRRIKVISSNKFGQPSSKKKKSSPYNNVA